MDGFETAFVAYGLAAVCTVMLVKAAGIPLPVPGDLILLATAAQVGQGKLVLWQAFGGLLLAIVAGGTLQFAIARGPGRGLVYRLGRFAGLSSQRLDAAASALQRRGPLSLTLALLTPGVRNAVLPASGLAGLSPRAFLLPLVLASSIDLTLHFAIGVFGGSVLNRLRPDPILVILGLAAAAALGLVGWLILSRRRAQSNTGEAVAAWQATACPVCVAVGALSIAAASPRVEVRTETRHLPHAPSSTSYS
jgi:membrane-associated protein